MPRLIRQSLSFAAVLAVGVAFAQQAPPAEPAAPPRAPNLQQDPLPPPNPRVEARGQIEENAATDLNQAPQLDQPAEPDKSIEADESIGSQINNEIQNELQDDSQLSDRRAALGVTFGDGLTIGRVRPNSPAARMGLQPGDQIISFNGEDFGEVEPFITSVRTTGFDEDVDVVYLRNGQEYTANGRLGEWQMVYAEPGYTGTHTTMRYADGGVAHQGYMGTSATCCAPAPAIACCDQSFTSHGGYGSGGGYGWDDDGRGRRHWRRARRCCW